MTPRILVVDDEPAVAELLAYNLRKSHYEVVAAADGREALRLARGTAPDLILLDLMLPEVDGFDVCRELRKTSSVPIILLTARGEEIDRVVGLELGADDYVAKPFSVRELLARIKAVLRRTQAGADAVSSPGVLIGPGGLELDLASRKALLGDTALDLTRLEFDLLRLLLSNRGRVLTRELLLEQAWGYDYAGDTRVIDSAIKRLRAKLRAAAPDGERLVAPEKPDRGDLIEAVRGVGYRIDG
jgi:two-component system, OmpR family, alkaline phosphatase synthesis response regulator PhoP